MGAIDPRSRLQGAGRRQAGIEHVGVLDRGCAFQPVLRPRRRNDRTDAVQRDLAAYGTEWLTGTVVALHPPDGADGDQHGDGGSTDGLPPGDTSSHVAQPPAHRYRPNPNASATLPARGVSGRSDGDRVQAVEGGHHPPSDDHHRQAFSWVRARSRRVGAVRGGPGNSSTPSVGRAVWAAAGPSDGDQP
jgi:hypothetical protein